MCVILTNSILGNGFIRIKYRVTLLGQTASTPQRGFGNTDLGKEVRAAELQQVLL